MIIIDIVISPEWYETVVGIIGIPVAVIGMIYTFFLINKVRLETRKTKLEILEKERQLGNLEPQTHTEVQLVKTNEINSIILRFILLFIVLKFWFLIEKLLEWVVGGIYLLTNDATDVEISEHWSTAIFVFFAKILPELIYWAIIISIGWPILRDINKYLNLNLKDFFKIK